MKEGLRVAAIFALAVLMCAVVPFAMAVYLWMAEQWWKYWGQ